LLPPPHVRRSIRVPFSQHSGSMLLLDLVGPSWTGHDRTQVFDFSTETRALQARPFFQTCRKAVTRPRVRFLGLANAQSHDSLKLSSQTDFPRSCRYSSLAPPSDVGPCGYTGRVTGGAPLGIIKYSCRRARSKGVKDALETKRNTPEALTISTLPALFPPRSAKQSIATFPQPGEVCGPVHGGAGTTVIRRRLDAWPSARHRVDLNALRTSVAAVRTRPSRAETRRASAHGRARHQGSAHTISVAVCPAPALSTFPRVRACSSRGSGPRRGALHFPRKRCASLAALFSGSPMD